MKRNFTLLIASLFLGALLTSSTGCALAITGDGLHASFGNSNTYDNGEEVTSGGEVSLGFAGIMAQIIKTAGNMVPFGSGEPVQVEVNIDAAALSEVSAPSETE